MKTIKIFLASSEELTDDRNAFGNFVRRLDKIYEKRGIRIELFEWEDYDAAFNNRRKQDEYNDQIKASDMFLALFHTKAGKFTIEEFDVATEEFRKKASPKVYTYCKDLQEGEHESIELAEFKKRLFGEMGHYWSRYNNRDSMQLHFVMQLQLVENSGKDKALTIDDDIVLWDNTPIAKMSNLKFVACNESYREMYSELSSFQEKIKKARQRVDSHPEDEEFREYLQDLLDNYNNLKHKFGQLQKALLNTAQRIAAMQLEMINEKLQKAIQAFEDGKIEVANIVLDEITDEAENHMTQLNQQRAVVFQDIEVYRLQTKTILADMSIPIGKRIEKVLTKYEKADECAEKSALEKDRYSNLLSDYVCFLFEYALYDKMVPICQRLVKMREEHYGLNNLFTASAYIFLAQAYVSQNMFSNAKEFHKKALGIFTNLVGENGLETAGAFNNIGGMFTKEGNFPKALEYYDKALSVFEQKEDKLKIATTANNIGTVSTIIGDFDKALEAFLKALEIRRELLNEEHPDIAASYVGIGTVYLKKGFFAKAFDYLSKATNIFEKELGFENPTTAMCYNIMGQVYHCQGYYSEAFNMCFKALRIREKVFGNNHTEVADSCNSLGLLYFSQEFFQEAKEYYSRAAAIYGKDENSVHPDLATIYTNMALIAYNEADLDTALAYNEKAVDLIIKLLGENHPNIATAYNNMGVIYDDLHNYSLALKFYFMAMEIREHAFGNRHAETIMSYKNIGAFFFERCDYINSLGYYNKALDAYKENADTENPEIEELKNTIEIVKNTMNGRQIEADYDSENSGFWSRFFRRK